MQIRRRSQAEACFKRRASYCFAKQSPMQFISTTHTTSAQQYVEFNLIEFNSCSITEHLPDWTCTNKLTFKMF